MKECYILVTVAPTNLQDQSYWDRANPKFLTNGRTGNRAVFEKYSEIEQYASRTQYQAVFVVLLNSSNVEQSKSRPGGYCYSYPIPKENVLGFVNLQRMDDYKKNKKSEEITRDDIKQLMVKNPYFFTETEKKENRSLPTLG